MQPPKPSFCEPVRDGCRGQPGTTPTGKDPLDPGRWHPRLGTVDRRLAEWMEHWGHRLHRWGLGLFFIWLGTLKALGFSSATTLIAKTAYLVRPEIAVPLLGVWEVAIGLCLCFRPLIRLALPLLALRLPGTLIALIMHADVCFAIMPWVPTIVGQYLIKDLLIFGAALVIGGTVDDEIQAAENRTEAPGAND